MNFEKASVEILRNYPDLHFEIEEKRISPEVAAKLFTKSNKKSNFNSSVSKVEQFMECPFKHFAQYGLKLEERKEYEFGNMDLGNLLHSALRKFGERMKAEGRLWSSVKEDELKIIVEEIFNELVPQFLNRILESNAAYKHQLERIKKVAIRSLRRLIELDGQSHFHPEKFEVGFGLPDGTEALKLNLDNGMKLNLSGRIDRIDFSEKGHGNFFLVIDYKTGDAFINLIDVFFGLNLQLLTYLFVANEQLVDKAPAAMLYCFLKYPSKSEKARMTEEEARKAIEKSLKMPGWVLAEPDVVKDIDASQKFIKVKLTTKGAIYQTDFKWGHVKTKEQFNLLLKHVSDTLQTAGNRIAGGDIEVKPYKADSKGNSPCKFCPYIAVCGFEQSFEKKNWRELQKLEDEDIFEKLSDKYGIKLTPRN